MACQADPRIYRPMTETAQGPEWHMCFLARSSALHCLVKPPEVRTYLNPAHVFMLLRVVSSIFESFCLRPRLSKCSHEMCKAHGTSFFAGVPDSLLKDRSCLKVCITSLQL